MEFMLWMANVAKHKTAKGLAALFSVAKARLMDNSQRYPAGAVIEELFILNNGDSKQQQQQCMNEKLDTNNCFAMQLNMQISVLAHAENVHFAKAGWKKAHSNYLLCFAPFAVRFTHVNVLINFEL